MARIRGRGGDKAKGNKDKEDKKSIRGKEACLKTNRGIRLIKGI
jgi:hypothetical protein